MNSFVRSKIFQAYEGFGTQGACINFAIMNNHMSVQNDFVFKFHTTRLAFAFVGVVDKCWRDITLHHSLVILSVRLNV